MIIALKELLSQKQITQEILEYIKEQLFSIYNELSPCSLVSHSVFLEFVNRTNVYIMIDERFTIIGVITALYERKLIHNGGIVCHVEDFVIKEEYRNLGYGKELLQHVITDAKTKKCYKIILDCNEEMRTYYEQMGFSRKNIQMALYNDN
jgi:GNAT superfamily N-acetyltransferase